MFAAKLDSLTRSSTPRPRIAVVDDERAYVCASMLVLGDEFDVVACEDASELLGRLHGGERFDLILADVNMPAMSGFQFFGRLRELDRSQADRVYFLTGDPDARSIPRDLEWRVVGKPSMGDELRSFVVEKLSRRRPAR